jgi:hypothetical protein
VDEPVVERAHEHQVLEVRPPSLFPPDDVVRLGEALGAAPRKAALAVPVLEVSDHPRRRLTRHATQTDRQPAFILDDRLPSGVACHPTGGVGVDGRTILDLTLPELAVRNVHAGVDDDGRPVGFVLGTASRRAQGDQSIRAPRVRAARAFLVGHGR